MSIEFKKCFCDIAVYQTLFYNNIIYGIRNNVIAKSLVWEFNVPKCPFYCLIMTATAKNT